MSMRERLVLSVTKGFPPESMLLASLSNSVTPSLPSSSPPSSTPAVSAGLCRAARRLHRDNGREDKAWEAERASVTMVFGLGMRAAASPVS